MSSITIQFVGLLLFTGRMVSVTPERAQPINSDYRPVAYRPMATIKPIPWPQRYEVTVLAPKVTHAGVEPHQTMILFKGTPISISGGWQRQTRPLRSGWSSISLSNSAHVEFVADIANSAVTPLTSVPLPKLGGTLKPAFTGPSYTGAAAVFTIKDGTLGTCNGGDGTRIDSTLRLNVGKSLIIKSGPNSIELPAAAQVVIANVPWAYADHPDTFSETGTIHSMAYCDMIGVPQCTMSHPQVTTACSYFLGGNYNKQASPTYTLGTDFACSNSQWP